jgi:hypothetical protein
VIEFAWVKVNTRQTDTGIMGARKILFMDMLRLITPEEISELVTKHEGEIKFALTEALEALLKGKEFDAANGIVENSDNVLQFPKAKTEETQELVCEWPRINDAESGQVEFKAESDTTSSFILSEKKRFEKNQRILKSREIHKLYQAESAVNVEFKRQTSKDLNKSSEVGLLLDKKHF